MDFYDYSGGGPTLGDLAGEYDGSTYASNDDNNSGCFGCTFVLLIIAAVVWMSMR